MNSSNRFRARFIAIVSMTISTLAFSGCDQVDTERRKEFISYCKTFQFVSDRDEKKLEQLRSLIRSGKINPDSDVAFHTLSIRAEDTQMWQDIYNLRILTFEVSSPGVESFHLRLPEAEISSGDSFSVSAPEHLSFDCFYLQKKTKYDFVEKGLSNEW